MKSFLIIGPAAVSLNRAEKLAQDYLKQPPTNHPDLFLVEAENSISINQIRRLNQQLTKKAFQAEVKVGLIHQAEKLTLPAQNALLKTLEEPPVNSIMILTAINPNQLIPTIISRCQLIKLNSRVLKPQARAGANQSLDPSQLLKLNQQLLAANLGQRLSLINPILKNRNLAKDWLEQELRFWHQALVKKSVLKQLKIGSKKAAEINQLINNSIVDLDHNINLKLILDNLILAW